MQTIAIPKQEKDRPLRVLIIEDAKSDVALLLLTLRDGGFAVTHELVSTQAAMRAALHNQWDLIISDHGMPQFSGQPPWPWLSNYILKCRSSLCPVKSISV